MKNFTKQPIVVPWDFSELASEALKKALDFCDTPDQIEIVHVTPYPSAVEPSVVWGAYSEDTIAENLHKSFQDEVSDELKALNFTALFGDPGTRISDFAKEKEAGLILISSHGRKGIPRLLLGSVAERVVRLAPCPVLVFRENE